MADHDKFQAWLTAQEACAEAIDWLGDRGPREAWAEAEPDDLIWAATRPGVLDDRSLRLFATWCVRRVWHLLDDERCRRAVEVAEAHARGLATDAELQSAGKSAGEAAWESAGVAAWSVTRESARVAALVAARESALVAAREASWRVAREAQARWLRENTTPDWSLAE